jgi:hypothetical protein
MLAGCTVRRIAGVPGPLRPSEPPFALGPTWPPARPGQDFRPPTRDIRPPHGDAVRYPRQQPSVPHRAPISARTPEDQAGYRLACSWMNFPTDQVKTARHRGHVSRLWEPDWRAYPTAPSIQRSTHAACSRCEPSTSNRPSRGPPHLWQGDRICGGRPPADELPLSSPAKAGDPVLRSQRAMARPCPTPAPGLLGHPVKPGDDRGKAWHQM